MLTPSSEGLGFDCACPPGFRAQLHVPISLITGGGPERILNSQTKYQTLSKW